MALQRVAQVLQLGRGCAGCVYQAANQHQNKQQQRRIAQHCRKLTPHCDGGSHDGGAEFFAPCRSLRMTQCRWSQYLCKGLHWGAFIALGWLVHPNGLWADLHSRCPRRLQRASFVLSALPPDTSSSFQKPKPKSSEPAYDAQADALPAHVKLLFAEATTLGGNAFSTAQDEAEEDEIVNKFGLFQSHPTNGIKDYSRGEQSRRGSIESEASQAPEKIVEFSALEIATSDLQKTHEKILARLEADHGLDLLLSGKDPKEGYQLLLSAASKGDVEAMHNLAVVYDHGTLGKQRLRKAARWYARASRFDYVPSMRNLADFYEKGLGGLARDDVKAEELRSRADRLESEASIRVHNEEECEYCEETAQRSSNPDVESSPDTLYEMGKLYEHGMLGMLQDEMFALELYNIAARGGHSQSKSASQKLQSKLYGTKAEVETSMLRASSSPAIVNSDVPVKQTISLTRLESLDSGVEPEDQSRAVFVS